MKLKPIFLFAAVATLSMSAQAASDVDKAAEAKAPAAGMPTDSMMKPDSNAEEKTSIQLKAPEAMSDKPDPAKDKKRHLHPRARSRFGALAFPAFP